MKRGIMCFVFVACFLLSVVPEHAVAKIVTHSVSASMVSLVTDPPTTVDVDTQLKHLFDVTFDDSATSYYGYVEGFNEFRTRYIDELLGYNHDLVFVSDASFTFSAEMLNVFSSLGISIPNENTEVLFSFVEGMQNFDNPATPAGYTTYRYSFKCNGLNIVFYTEQYGAYDNPNDQSDEIIYFVNWAGGSVFDFVDQTYWPPTFHNRAVFSATQFELQFDGAVGATGGTVVDGEFGELAQLVVPVGAVQDGTTVNINVFTDDPVVNLPNGVSTTDSYFVNIHLEPEPDYPLAPPGMTVVLPLKDYIAPEVTLYLWRVNPDTGDLEPSIGVDGVNQVIGYVDPEGWSATFTGVAGFSTVVALSPIQVNIDIKPGSYPNSFNLNGNGVIPVAILGSPELEVEDIMIDDTLAFNGLAVRVRGKKGPLCSVEYSNDDEFPDLVCHFEDDPETWIIGNETTATLTGELMDGTKIEGTDSIRIVP